MNYEIGNVYKIICSLDSNFIYIGSTFQKLKKRWIDHKSEYKRYLKDEILNMSTHKYYKKYGIENFKIVLIKSYNVCRDSDRDNTHLKVYEQLWINKTKRSVNCNNAFNPLFKLDIKAKHKIYRESNKEKKKEYYENNKEKKKEYYQTNKVKILGKMKEKITCECGTNITRTNLTTHKKSKKHAKLMQDINILKII